MTKYFIVYRVKGLKDCSWQNWENKEFEGYNGKEEAIVKLSDVKNDRIFRSFEFLIRRDETTSTYIKA